MSRVHRRLATALALIFLAAGAQPAAAIVDRGGTTVPNTATTGTAAQLSAGPTVTQKLFTPESPGDDDPVALSAKNKMIIVFTGLGVLIGLLSIGFALGKWRAQKRWRERYL